MMNGITVVCDVIYAVDIVVGAEKRARINFYISVNGLLFVVALKPFFFEKSCEQKDVCVAVFCAVFI